MRDADRGQIGEPALRRSQLARTGMSGAQSKNAKEEEIATTVFSGDVVPSVDIGETEVESVEKPHNERLDNTCTISPIKPSRQ